MIAWRTAAILALLMGVGSVLGTSLRPRTFLADTKPAIELTAIFPAQFGAWKIDPSIIPLQPSPDLQQALDESYSETLSRTYVRPDGKRIMLSVAYGRNQHKGMNWHRPEICYPAQGIPISVPTSRADMSFAGRPLPISRLVAANQSRIEPISYWVVVGDRVTSFGRAHKLVSLEYGLRGYIPDGMLVRVSSINKEVDEAFADQREFITDMLQGMSPAARQIVLGTRAPFVGSDLMPTMSH
ncbi:MAG: EpsI family protein [Roseateles depolymerans]|uniref:EpsI family protein n=1 Tax=Roseateles depolymerans TaxID=76731 RepID=A0A2W5DDE1_9BURK|nr:MAG: EpsI family protein [Roseateles depolymerans]